MNIEQRTRNFEVTEAAKPQMVTIERVKAFWRDSVEWFEMWRLSPEWNKEEERIMNIEHGTRNFEVNAADSRHKARRRV